MRGDPCVLDDARVCQACGECDQCDLDATQPCTNCMRCIQTGASYRGLRIDAILDESGQPMAKEISESAPPPENPEAER